MCMKSNKRLPSDIYRAAFMNRGNFDSKSFAVYGIHRHTDTEKAPLANTSEWASAERIRLRTLRKRYI